MGQRPAPGARQGQPPLPQATPWVTQMLPEPPPMGQGPIPPAKPPAGEGAGVSEASPAPAPCPPLRLAALGGVWCCQRPRSRACHAPTRGSDHRPPNAPVSDLTQPQWVQQGRCQLPAPSWDLLVRPPGEDRGAAAVTTV